MRWPIIAVLALACLANSAIAAEPSKAVTSVSAYPTALKLKGMDNAPQLLITGKRTDGRNVDLTHTATYSVSDPKVIRVEASGRVFPLANGTAEITAVAAGFTVKVSVTAEKMEAPLSINFANHVVPIFTKLGCSSGGSMGRSRARTASACHS